MNLNTKQKAIILVGVAAIVLMGIFPPWVHTWNFLDYDTPQTAQQHLGYGLLSSPPTAGEFRPVSINMQMLFVQWFVSAVATFGLVLVAGGKKRNGEASC